MALKLLLLLYIITFLGVGGVSRAIQQMITFCMYKDIYNVQEKSVISSASIFFSDSFLDKDRF